MRHRERLLVEGRVQGVGFRPLVYRLAQRMDLTGYVQNTSSGVTIELQGEAVAISAFKSELHGNTPSQVIITQVNTEACAVDSSTEFVIKNSVDTETVTTAILPDRAVCSECLRELSDINSRRYRDPFISCTDCGPRYSLVSALPYDRHNTSMVNFELCGHCRSEFNDPNNRRYHSQTQSCPECGPRLELRDTKGVAKAQGEKAIQLSAQLIRKGKIVALKGLGGFHLLCDARNTAAVTELRRRKARLFKPLAVMYPSLEHAQRDGIISDEEKIWLTSPESPIVIVSKKPNLHVAKNIAPSHPNIGVMLPYTPLHYLLLGDLGFPVVATSGNVSGEPICIDEDQALRHLNGIADGFLVHDRPIVSRCDDSIVRMMAGRVMLLRRARGYAPLPITLKPHFSEPVVAVGGHLKNTVALAIEHHVMLSTHIGDLSAPEACSFHQEAIEKLCELYKVSPKTIAHDAHPDYRSTQLADKHDGDQMAVQHHYAHALACMAEHDIETDCLAVTWDGSGYGADGSMWGGEFLRINADADGYDRVWHFLPFLLPGGDVAAKDPRRSALGMLYELKGDSAFDHDLGFNASEVRLLKSALLKRINCPRTSSVGRIFDATSALCGLCLDNSYEGEAAMMLEFAGCLQKQEPYDYGLDDGVIDWKPMLSGILDDLEKGVKTDIISSRFHATLVDMIVAVAKVMRNKTVLLTGGCFQNKVLLESAVEALTRAGYTPRWPQRVPPNDGGLALGQIMAYRRFVSS